MARISTRWAEILERLGIPVPPNVKPGDELHRMPTFVRYQAGEITDAQYIHDLAVYLGGLTYEQARAVHRSILVEPYPGVEPIVRTLNASGTVTGCLSNTNAPHWEDLAMSGRFPAISMMPIRLASFEIGASKPHPEAYTAFEEACGCEPSQILLFDDSPANCRAAIDLAWTAVRIDSDADPARQMRATLRGAFRSR